MAQADANRVSVYFSEETVWGETPSNPTMTVVPFTSDAMVHNKETAIDETIRDDRMQTNVISVGEDGGGTIDFNFRSTTYDSLFEGLMGNDFAATTVNVDGATDISATAPSTFTSATTDWVTEGLVVGMWFRTAGFTEAANNDLWKVSTVNNTVVVVTQATVATEASGDAIDVDAKMLRNGVAKKSYLVEKKWEDITQFMYWSGQRVSQMDLTVASRSIITGTFTFMGEGGTPASTSITTVAPVAAATRDVFDASNDVATIEEGGAALATAVNNLALTVNNNNRMQPAIANVGPIGIGYGVLEVTGSLEAYFEDLVLLNKFRSHAATELMMRLTDNDGRDVVIFMPEVFYEEGSPPTPGGNQDIFLPLTFRAVRDATLDYVIQIDLVGLSTD